MKNHAWSSGIAAFGFTCLVLPCAAQADVTISQLTHFDEVTGIASHDTTSTDYIQGDKKREENLRKFTGSVLGAWQKFRGEDNGALDIDIYIVGDNKHYDLDPKKKTYSEDAIYDPQQQAKGGNRNQQAGGQQQKDSDTKITKNELTVKATGEKKNINGFDTTEYLVTWDVETENTKTGEKGKSLMTTDLWNSTDAKLAKAHEEEAAYAKAYLKLMQAPYDMDEMKAYGFGTMSINSADSKQFFDKLSTIKGYPVSTDVKWETASTGAKGAASNSNAQQAHPQTLDSALGSLLGGNKKSDDSQKPAATPGMTMLFSSHIEIKSVDTGAVAASQFEVPADYKKED
ncbi:MAG TPA: hypothetical protein VGT99_13855 [Gammaproteobacteria bacterium]|nr:hypothetical protein [Gammaproteobacteria bacterium]